ncbi:uncharacterized protein LOC131662927 [Phymastichus coffea]|uniref:uncharacterized protein LOC131662927 n=1 Tax=Phymastichus coffea TaxID=108790 RepID=UPI00273B4CF2|nr:uncharacterized protein LOC131662927 [Phymastichus coffea]
MNRLLIVCLTIVSAVQSQHLSSMIQLPLLESSHVKLENGIDPNHLLVIECINSNKAVELECTVTIHLTDNSTDICSLTLAAKEDMDDIELLSIHQLSDNKVMIVWGDFEPRRGSLSYYQSIFYIKRITIVEMSTCASVKTLLHRYFLGSRRRLQAVVPFAEGFDAVVTCQPYYENCSSTRESYDSSGNELGEVEALPVQLEHISALAVSREDRSAGIFIYGTSDDLNTNVSHVAAGSVKRSLSLRTDIRQAVSHADGEGSLAICGRVVGKPRFIECTHYDATTNKVVEYRTSLPGYVDVVGVRRLRNGSLLLLAIDDNEIMLAVMGKDRHVTFAVPIDWRATTGKCRVRGFNEKEANFGFVCETHVEGKRSLVTQMFALPAKLRENQGENSTET